MANTESPLRARNGPTHRLTLALLDILTGVTEASVTLKDPYNGNKSWVFNVKKSGIQDD